MQKFNKVEDIIEYNNGIVQFINRLMSQGYPVQLTLFNMAEAKGLDSSYCCEISLKNFIETVSMKELKQ